jgi:hypothetical protein
LLGANLLTKLLKMKLIFTVILAIIGLNSGVLARAGIATGTKESDNLQVNYGYRVMKGKEEQSVVNTEQPFFTAYMEDLKPDTNGTQIRNFLLANNFEGIFRGKSLKVEVPEVEPGNQIQEGFFVQSLIPQLTDQVLFIEREYLIGKYRRYIWNFFFRWFPLFFVVLLSGFLAHNYGINMQDFTEKFNNIFQSLENNSWQFTENTKNSTVIQGTCVAVNGPLTVLDAAS